jgi:hypothetical protein
MHLKLDTQPSKRIIHIHIHDGRIVLCAVVSHVKAQTDGKLFSILAI